MLKKFSRGILTLLVFSLFLSAFIVFFTTNSTDNTIRLGTDEGSRLMTSGGDSPQDLEVNIEFEQAGQDISVLVSIRNPNTSPISNVKLEEIWESAVKFTPSSFNVTEWSSIESQQTVYTEANLVLIEQPNQVPLDFAITIDASGSMSGEINAIQDKLVEILNILRTKSSVRAGISVFGWTGSHGYNPYLTPDTLTVPLTENITDVIDFVNTLYASGGTEPEGDSFYHMNRAWDWREDAQKVVVLIGDEPDNGGTMVNGYYAPYTLQEEAEYTALNNVQVIGIQSGYQRTDCQRDQKVFVDATNGLYRFFPSGQEDDLPSFIINGIESLKNSMPILLNLTITYDYDGQKMIENELINYNSVIGGSTYIGEPSVSFTSGNPTYINVESNIYDGNGINEAKIVYRYGEIFNDVITWGDWNEQSMVGDSFDRYQLSATLSHSADEDFVFQFKLHVTDGNGNITIKEDFAKPYWIVKTNTTDYAPVISSISRSPPSNITINDEVVINASVSDDRGINSVNIYYRIDNGKWQQATMSLISGSPTNGVYQYNHGKMEGGITVEYYIEAEDNRYQLTKDDNNGLRYIFKVRGEGGEDFIFPTIECLKHTPAKPGIFDPIKIELNLTDNKGIDQSSVKLIWTTEPSFSNPVVINLTADASGHDASNQYWYHYTHTIPAQNMEVDLYYKIIAKDTAYNEIESNIKKISINIPDACVLGTNATTPDIDGDFEVMWTESPGADTYLLYIFDKPITEINDSLTLEYDGAESKMKSFSDMETGTYYFIVSATNQSGYALSNTLKIEVDRTLELQDDDGKQDSQEPEAEDLEGEQGSEVPDEGADEGVSTPSTPSDPTDSNQDEPNTEETEENDENQEENPIDQQSEFPWRILLIIAIVGTLVGIFSYVYKKD